jgi:hypothetical protein
MNQQATEGFAKTGLRSIPAAEGLHPLGKPLSRYGLAEVAENAIHL